MFILADLEKTFDGGRKEWAGTLVLSLSGHYSSLGGVLVIQASGTNQFLLLTCLSEVVQGSSCDPIHDWFSTGAGASGFLCCGAFTAKGR